VAEKEARPRRAHVQATATAGRRTPKAAQRLDVRGVWVARAREQCAAAAEQSTERRVSEEAAAAGTSPASAQRHSLHAWRPSSAGTPPVSAPRRRLRARASAGRQHARSSRPARAPPPRSLLPSAPRLSSPPGLLSLSLSIVDLLKPCITATPTMTITHIVSFRYADSVVRLAAASSTSSTLLLTRPRRSRR